MKAFGRITPHANDANDACVFHTRYRFFIMVLIEPSIIFIDREAREIMYLVASIRPSVRLSVSPSGCTQGTLYTTSVWVTSRLSPYVCPSVCPSGCTQGTLYTTTTVYGLLVHQEGAICSIKAQYAPRCTRETLFFGSQVFERVTLLQLFLGSQ